MCRIRSKIVSIWSYIVGKGIGVGDHSKTVLVEREGLAIWCGCFLQRVFMSQYIILEFCWSRTSTIHNVWFTYRFVSQKLRVHIKTESEKYNLKIRYEPVRTVVFGSDFELTIFRSENFVSDQIEFVNFRINPIQSRIFFFPNICGTSLPYDHPKPNNYHTSFIHSTLTASTHRRSHPSPLSRSSPPFPDTSSLRPCEFCSSIDSWIWSICSAGST